MEKRKRSRSRSRSGRRHHKRIEYSHKERLRYKESRSRSRSSEHFQYKQSSNRRHTRRSRSRTPPRHNYNSRSRSRSNSGRRDHREGYRNRRSRSRSHDYDRQSRDYSHRGGYRSRRSGSRSYEDDRQTNEYTGHYRSNQYHQSNSNTRHGSSPAFMEIFQLLREFRKQVIEYLNSAFKSEVRPMEIFMRWYLNSLLNGARDYFMPNTFIALENDIDYYKDLMLPNVTKQDIKDKIQAIWETFKDKRYFTKPDDKSYLITEKQRRRLHSLYTGPEENYERLKNLLLSAYEFMGNMNNHLSVPPVIFQDTKIVELFGSPFNTSQAFCSPFKIEQDYFGSLGSFFQYNICEGINIANPPFDETLMEEMADRLEDQLTKTAGISVICIIPVWDPKSQEQYGLKNFNKRFIAFEKLESSKFLKEKHYLAKDLYPFWNYYKEGYFAVSAIHMIILSNADQLPFDPLAILEKWKSLKAN